MSASKFGTITPAHEKSKLPAAVAVSVPSWLAVNPAVLVANLNDTGIVCVVRPEDHFGRIRFLVAAVSMMADTD